MNVSYISRKSQPRNVPSLITNSTRNCINIPSIKDSEDFKHIELHTWIFNDGRQRIFEEMLKVLIHSCQKINVPLNVHRVADESEKFRQIKGIDDNYFKLKHWNQFVQSIDKPVIIIDSDILCMRDPRPFMSHVEHMALTFKLPNSDKFNGGCIYVQPSDISKNIFKKWIEIDDLLYHDSKLHSIYRSKYHGMNQSSMGYILENFTYPIQRLYTNWVNECEDWECFEQAYMIHIKGRLRRYIFDRCDGSNEVNVSMFHIKKLWLKLRSEIND